MTAKKCDSLLLNYSDLCWCNAMFLLLNKLICNLRCCKSVFISNHSSLTTEATHWGCDGVVHKQQHEKVIVMMRAAHLSWWNEPADWTKQSRMSVIHEVIGHWLDCLCVILINYPDLKFDRSHQQSRKYSLSIDHDNCPKWVHTNNYLCPVVMRRLLSNVHHSIRERDTSPQPQPTPPATPTRSRSHKR